MNGESDTDDLASTEDRRSETLAQMRKIEQEFRDVKTRLFQEKMNKLDTEIEQLEEGAHPEYLVRVSVLAERKAERMSMAKLRKQYMMDAVQRLFVSEEEQASSEYEENVSTLRETMLKALKTDRERTQVENQTLDLQGDIPSVAEQTTNRTMTRKLRKRQNEAQAALLAKQRKMTMPTAPAIVYELTQDEISEDLSLVKKMLKSRMTKKHQMAENDTLYDCYFQDGLLVYDKSEFVRGHKISVENKNSGRYHAVITAINSGEVWVKRSDGSKAKLYISQLKLGKYYIRLAEDMSL